MKNNFVLPDINEARKRNKNSVTTRVLFELKEEYKNLGLNKIYSIRTHGCQANIRDSEEISGILETLGYTPGEEKDADLIIINTCAVRQNAEDKVYGEIGALKRLKKEKPNLIIGLCGCMAQEEKTIKEILDKYRQVDIIFGTHNIDALPKLLFEVIQSNKRQIEVNSIEGFVVEKTPVTRFDSHKAWVNIMYGCNKFCTYCIVPYTRGKERSRLLEDVVDEVNQLIKEGYKEVCLLGQNVDAYGKDLNLGYGFGDLLDAVAKTNIPRVRFMTSHPKDFDDHTIDALANNSNIMPYLHLPVQSGNSEILRKMNRKYTREEYIELFDKLKARVPHYAFTTDIIVGFPNESEEQFKDTLSMVDHCKYDNAFTFVYSKREGTPAAAMPDGVDIKVKEERLQKLNEKVAYYANLNNQKYKDKVVEVLVDGISKKNAKAYSGYTPENKLVNFVGEDVKVGEIVKVKITEIMSFSLNGIKL